MSQRAIQERAPWPGQETHSNGGRPIIYRGTESGRWWVDASALIPHQRGFSSWAHALAFALRLVEAGRTSHDSEKSN